MKNKKLKPRTSSGRKQSGSKETNGEVKIQHTPCPDYNSMWANGLPQEILLKIFSMAVDEEGVLPFLCRAAGVCRSWRSPVSDSQLWRDVDLDKRGITRDARTLRSLVDNRFSRVTKLNLSCWEALESEDYVYLFDSCRQLQTLNLTNCYLTSTTIEALSTLPNLQNLNLSGALYAVTHLRDSLCLMLSSLGPRLMELNLSGNHIKGYDAIMNALMANCPNLTLLDFSSCTYYWSGCLFNIERLQQCCPKLRVLRLQDTALPAVEADEETVLASYGFPDLEEVNLSVSGMKYDDGSYLAYDDVFIARLLKNSPKLRDLNVSKCIRVSHNSLLKLPAQNLKNLQVSRCSYILSYTGICGIIKKWKHSLENIGLSWNVFPDGSLGKALELMAQHRTPVRSLNLAGTRVSKKAIRTLLTGCRQLMMLDLSCTIGRDLPCCVIQRHEGRKALRELFKKLS